MLIGCVAPMLAKKSEGLEISGVTKMVFALGKARWISIPIWLAIFLGGALAIRHYSEKTTRCMLLLKSIMILGVIFIVVAFYFLSEKPVIRFFLASYWY
jgi:hypothetical protein